MVVLKKTCPKRLDPLAPAGGPDAVLVFDLRLIELLRDFPKKKHPWSDRD